MADIYTLLYHLKGCPSEFLASMLVPTDTSHPNALLLDVYRKVYGDFTVATSELPSTNNSRALDENQAMSIQIGCWFFHHDFFASQPDLLPKIHAFLFEHLREVCGFVKFPLWVEDEDRSEEFVRIALDCLDMVPAGETFDEASDKLDALSTLKRHGVLKQTNQSLARIKEIRRKMAEEKAREAANVYGRE